MTDTNAETIRKLTCERCGWQWWPKSAEKPKVCAKCHSPYYDRPRQKPKEQSAL